MTGLKERLLDYPRIVADFHGERVTLFIGAGFSRYFRDLPSWDELVAYLWTELGRKPTARSRPKDLYAQMALIHLIVRWDGWGDPQVIGERESG